MVCVEFCVRINIKQNGRSSTHYGCQTDCQQSHTRETVHYSGRIQHTKHHITDRSPDPIPAHVGRDHDATAPMDPSYRIDQCLSRHPEQQEPSLCVAPECIARDEAVGDGLLACLHTLGISRNKVTSLSHPGGTATVYSSTGLCISEVCKVPVSQWNIILSALSRVCSIHGVSRGSRSTHILNTGPRVSHRCQEHI